jgi:adenosylmethionine-8-amino-7-oxononanoate aminotransferase
MASPESRFPIRSGTGADKLADAIRAADPETVAAVIVEPVLSAGGCIIPPLGWLARVRDICDELDVLMIADEVITGFGRTGKWFGVQHEEVIPDLMSVAKGITSGYLPLSASIARAKIADAFDEKSTEENVHPGTYCGHPVSCAAGLANIAIIERENLVKNAELMGARLHSTLENLVGDLPIVGEVRSRGLMLAIELVDPQRRDQPLDKRLTASLNIRQGQRLPRGAAAFDQRRGGRRACAHPCGIAEGVARRAVPLAPHREGGGSMTCFGGVAGLAAMWRNPPNENSLCSAIRFAVAPYANCR